jgi:hypothetical protein
VPVVGGADPGCRLLARGESRVMSAAVELSSGAMAIAETVFYFGPQ